MNWEHAIIRECTKRLMAAHHPDRVTTAQEKASATEDFKQIGAARSRLLQLLQREEQSHHANPTQAGSASVRPQTTTEVQPSAPISLADLWLEVFGGSIRATMESFLGIHPPAPRRPRKRASKKRRNNA